jgi:hypothetical protein
VCPWEYQLFPQFKYVLVGRGRSLSGERFRHLLFGNPVSTCKSRREELGKHSEGLSFISQPGGGNDWEYGPKLLELGYPAFLRSKETHGHKISRVTSFKGEVDMARCSMGKIE